MGLFKARKKLTKNWLRDEDEWYCKNSVSLDSLKQDCKYVVYWYSKSISNVRVMYMHVSYVSTTEVSYYLSAYGDVAIGSHTQVSKVELAKTGVIIKHAQD